MILSKRMISITNCQKDIRLAIMKWLEKGFDVLSEFFYHMPEVSHEGLMVERVMVSD